MSQKTCLYIAGPLFNAHERAYLDAPLTCPDHDAGTCVELDYLFTKGVPCFGLTDDVRHQRPP